MSQLKIRDKSYPRPHRQTQKLPVLERIFGICGEFYLYLWFLYLFGWHLPVIFGLVKRGFLHG
jgi:hypothetical protein